MRPWWLALCSLWLPSGRRPVRTPIRWLCLRAFVYLGVSSGTPLDSDKLDQLGQLLELGVFLNRCLDGKSTFCPIRYRRLRRGLPVEPLRRYLGALRRVERGRPDRTRWKCIALYRREVSDLSLLALFEIAGLGERPVLSPLVGLVQLVDDILDQEIDRTLDLPSLVGPLSPSTDEQAVWLWKELRGHHDGSDTPLVGMGFLVYLLARLVGHLHPRRW